jgi:hypothetical protein
MKGSVDVCEGLSVCDELVDLELTVHIVGNKIRELRTPFDTSEGATLPYTTCDELES